MKNLKKKWIGMQTKAYCAMRDFMKAERGDTNFISIIIIIAIVVVLAGFMIAVVNMVMERSGNALETFLDGLDGVTSPI